MGNQIVARQGLERIRVTRRIRRVGMRTVQLAIERLLNHGGRIGQIALQRDQGTGALTLEGPGRKIRLAHDQCQQFQRRLQQPGLAQTAQLDDGHVATGILAILGAEPLEATRDLAGIEPARTLVQEAVGHERKTGFAHRVAAGGRVEHQT